jgi:dephospho-CoA kinase
MKLCGLTGGVGMGKSTAAGFFLELGARVVDTDKIAHDLVQPGQPALEEIRNQFGGGILAAGGSLNRAALARIVFSDATALRRLEAILHPRIRRCWQTQVENWRAEKCPLAVVIIPLLFETRAENQFDQIICVACSPASQHERLCARGWTPDQIRQRIATQMSVEQKMARSHFVVWSEGLPEVHQRQLSGIFRKM